MKRTALSCAALFVTASALLYLAGLRAVFILGSLLCFAAAVCAVLGRRKGIGFKPAAVLLIGAAFCLFLNIYSSVKVDRIEALAGTTRTVTCRVTEEPYRTDDYVKLEVETDGSNGFDGGLTGSVELILYINSDEPGYEAEEGDILTAEVAFEELDKSVRKDRWAEEIFVSSDCVSAEIVGHKETLYSYCIDLRRAVRSCIDTYVDGDAGAVLKGLTLGDVSGMSDELYSQFKISGVAHITAVSGMHIGAFCMMVTTLLGLIMNRRKASALALIPLVLTVMLAGLTPSAIRAGIMCGMMLLADCFLKKTDSLNSLGVAVSVMLVFDPFYILSLSFQLSCSATAGVILSAPYGMTLANRLAKFRFEPVNKVIKGVVSVFVQSIGAVVCTLPFQIIAFGFISVIAPVASVLICSAAVYAMAVSVVGAIFHFIPFGHYIAMVPFAAAELLARYIIAVVGLLSRLPFSYVPFGNNIAVMWIGLSLAIVALWAVLNKPGGKRAVALIISLMLVASLWSDRLTSDGLVEVAVLDTGNGLCTVVSYDGKCVIIGCGDDSSDRYVLRSHLKQRGITEVELLLIPSDSDSCFKGYEGLLNEVSPGKTVVPDNFGNSTVFTGGVIAARDGAEFQADGGSINIKAVHCENACVYEVTCCGKRFLVGSTRYDAAELGVTNADFVITSRALPKNTGTDLTVISSAGEMNFQTPGKVLTTSGYTISVKLKNGKGMTIYAGQS